MINREDSNIMTFPLKAEPISAAQSLMETKLLTLEEMNAWVLPPFQREEVQNKKVVEFAEGLKRNGGLIGGVIHLGVLRNETTIFLVDGQQRRGGCNLTGLNEFIADVSLKIYDSMATMAEDFKSINSRLVALRPDDLLRAYEMSHADLRQLRAECPFVGYANVRRSSEKGAILSMGATLKCWFGSAMPTPACQGNAIELLDQFTETQRQQLTVFLHAAHSAWGNEKECFRLWCNLNLLMCMYLFRKLTLEPTNRRAAVPPDMFRKCLLSVSAASQYSDWLQGRSTAERDRGPCYKRLKCIFADRLTQEYGGNFTYRMPKPEWV